MMKHELKSLVCAVSVGCGALCACAADLYFSIDDDTKKDWSYGPGWKANAGAAGVLPRTNDTVTLNSSYLNVAAGRVPLTIPEGVDATCHTLWIGSLAQADGGSLAVRRRDDPEKADSWEVLTGTRRPATTCSARSRWRFRRRTATRCSRPRDARDAVALVERAERA